MALNFRDAYGITILKVGNAKRMAICSDGVPGNTTQRNVKPTLVVTFNGDQT